MIVCRAVLGHPYLAKRQLPNSLRPPLVENYDMPHDYVIAKPGVPNGKGQGKAAGKTSGFQANVGKSLMLCDSAFPMIPFQV